MRLRAAALIGLFAFGVVATTPLVAQADPFDDFPSEGKIRALQLLIFADVALPIGDLIVMYQDNGNGKKVYGTIEAIIAGPQALFALFGMVFAAVESSPAEKVQNAVLMLVVTGYFGFLTTHGIVLAVTGGTHCCRSKPERSPRSLDHDAGGLSTSLVIEVGVAAVINTSLTAIDLAGLTGRGGRAIAFTEIAVAVPEVILAAHDPNAATIGIAAWAVGLAAHGAIRLATHREVPITPIVVPGGGGLSFAGRF